ncbi:uncharacterized protein LOC128134292 [Lactuca sativa]|uniref:uncharacterized protein LOC128134292 n=1 Tax=Lactuca sativa TaxID=4236 RepID=UPI0022B07175|nr:uncharacterized protein LOC128134292 [Lactuca sativa]
MSLANYSNMNSVSIANSLGSGSRAPILIPEEYNSWVGRMNLHLNAINEDVWKCVEGTYVTPENMATLATNQATQVEITKKLELQAKKELVSGIPHSILSQMDDIILLTANQIWENLKNRFCGNKRIIGNKRTSVLNEFDNFKMLSSETIHDAHDRFNLIMGNPAIHTETLYNLYGELQSYESSIDPPTTAAFGGPLALVSTTSQNQTPFNDQNFNHFNQTTSFQNQAFQSDSNDEADYQQLECRAKNKTKIKDSAYYAQRADELKKLENQEKQRALMAIHEPSVEYWPTSDDEAEHEPTQSNFCFVAGVEIPSRAPNVIEQNKRLIWNMDSIKVARKLSDDIFTKANSLGTGKIDTNYRPGIGRESFEIEQAKQENMTNCENSESTLPNLFTSVNEEDSDEETVINCSPDDTAFSVSKKSFKRVVNSETDFASSLTHQIKHTDRTTKLKNFLNGENSSYEDGSTSIPTAFPTMTSSIVGKTSLGQKYSKKQQTSKKSIEVTKTPLIKPNFFEKQPKKPVKPYVIPHKQVSKQKPKSFQKPFENRFQDITFNHSRNFQKPSHQKVSNHHHQKAFQNRPSHPRYEENFSNKPSHLGYLSPNHRSYQPTGFQKQIAFWVLNAGEPNDDSWYIDSGCSKHMTGNRNYLRDFKPIQTNQDVTFGNNMKAKIKGYGNITNGNFTIKKVAFVDDLKHNLISVSQLCDNNLEVLFTKQRSLIMDAKTKDVIVDSNRAGNMYPLDMDLIYGKPDICLLSKAPADISWLWHRRLSHLNFGYINKLIGDDLV